MLLYSSEKFPQFQLLKSYETIMQVNILHTSRTKPLYQFLAFLANFREH